MQMSFVSCALADSRAPRIFVDLLNTRCGNHFYNLECIRNSQPILRLHRHVICHMIRNFVGFQNMCDFKMSDS